MARKENQKLKLFRVREIMLRKTDENNGITMQQIIEELAKYDIDAERKSIYTDLDELEKLGIKIEKTQVGRETYYKAVTRDFSMAELKLLVDAVQSSKFITDKKTRELIKKIEGLASEHEARKLNREVVVSGRVKTMNESIYKLVDVIHDAIGENKQIRFTYYVWDVKKRLVPKRESFYEVSPLALIWDDENYYMVAYDSEEQKIKHFRVDKIKSVVKIDSSREGKEMLTDDVLASYTKRNFGMFGGKEEDVRLRIRNEMAGIFIDKFGKDELSFIPDGEGYSTVRVKVAVSMQFIGWVFSLGDAVQIISPAGVVEKVKAEAERLYEMYVK